MAFNITYVYQVITSQASRALKDIANKQKAVARTAATAAIKTRRFGDALDRLRRRAKSASEKLRNLGSAMTLRVTAPLGILVGLALRSSANLETLQVSFESMLGSADKARVVMKQLIDFTARTPFQLEGVGRSAKQLLAFGVTTEELMPTLRVLGDISAGANVPLNEMAAIFGKVKAKGKAYTEELLQLSDRGIPIISVLSDRFGVAKEAIFDMASDGKLSFEVIQEAMRSMTGKGGIFFKQMERQSKTLTGIFSTLKDNVNLALGELGNTLVKNLKLKETLKDVIAGIQAATKAFAEFSKNNPKLVKFGLIVAGLAFVLGPIIATLGFMLIGFSLLSGPVLAVVAAFGVLVLAGAGLAVVWDDFMRGLQRISDFANDVWSSFIKGLERIADFAVAITRPIIAAWDSVVGAIFGSQESIENAITAPQAITVPRTSIARAITAPQASIASGIEKIGGVLSGGGPEVRASGSQELTGRMAVDINLSGNTGAVKSVSARSIGNGNLGTNMRTITP